MTKWKTLAFVALICVFAPSAYGQLPLQNFDGAFPPFGWTVADWEGTGNFWDRNDAFTDPEANTNQVPGGDGFCATAAGNDSGSGAAWDTMMYTPPFNLVGYSTVDLTFNHFFSAGTDGEAAVWLYDGVVGYYPLASYTSNTSGSVTISLNKYIYFTGVQIAFQYSSGDNETSIWQIDNVAVTGVVTGIDLSGAWGLFRYDGRLFARVDVTNIGWNPSGTFSVRLQVFDNTFTNVLYDTTRTFAQNARGRALLPGRTKKAKFWVTNRNDLRNGWALATVVRAAGPDDYDGAYPNPFSNNWLLRQVQ